MLLAMLFIQVNAMCRDRGCSYKHLLPVQSEQELCFSCWLRVRSVWALDSDKGSHTGVPYPLVHCGTIMLPNHNQASRQI